MKHVVLHGESLFPDAAILSRGSSPKVVLSQSEFLGRNTAS